MELCVTDRFARFKERAPSGTRALGIDADRAATLENHQASTAMRANFIRHIRRIKIALVTSVIGVAPLMNGCWDSDIAKRFREAYEPGFVAGLSMAIDNPAQSQLGFRRLGQAFFEGLGAIISPRTESSAGGRR